MKKVYSLDTNIISFILKGNTALINKITLELENGNDVVINPVSYYEIVRGLINISKKKLEKFQGIYEDLTKVNLDKAVFDKSAEIYSELKLNGNIIEDADIFIGAICIVNDFILVTNNTKHLSRINGLKIEDWS